MQDVNQD